MYDIIVKVKDILSGKRALTVKADIRKMTTKRFSLCAFFSAERIFLRRNTVREARGTNPRFRKGDFMKKFFAVILSAAVFATAGIFAACSSEEENKNQEEEKTPESFTVVMPDGAPALSVAKLLAEDEEGDEVTYQVVDSSTIQTYVTGENPSADACVLPVNLASKLLGSGETYKMVGASTHGNLYIISATTNEEVTKDNISSLAGKTIGVVNLANVPGLILKSVLTDNGLGYNEVGNDGEKSGDKVNLVAVDGSSVVPTDGIDYFVVPEPAATTKVNKVAAFNFVGDLQALYGEGEGYVQAVLVVKTSYIENSPTYISEFLKEVSENYEWISSAEATTVTEAVTAHLTEGMTPTFTAANLNAQVIEHCNLTFTYAKDCVDETKEIIERFISIKSGSAATVSDSFFCTEFGK